MIFPQNILIWVCLSAITDLYMYLNETVNMSLKTEQQVLKHIETNGFYFKIYKCLLLTALVDVDTSIFVKL